MLQSDYLCNNWFMSAIDQNQWQSLCGIKFKICFCLASNEKIHVTRKTASVITRWKLRFHITLRNEKRVFRDLEKDSQLVRSFVIFHISTTVRLYCSIFGVNIFWHLVHSYINLMTVKRTKMLSQTEVHDFGKYKSKSNIIIIPSTI